LNRQGRRRLERKGKHLVHLGEFDVKDGKINTGEIVYRLTEAYRDRKIGKVDLIEKLKSLVPDRKEIFKYVDAIDLINKTKPTVFKWELCNGMTFRTVRPFEGIIFTCVIVKKHR
jgi:hypothetical protein